MEVALAKHYGRVASRRRRNAIAASFCESRPTAMSAIVCATIIVGRMPTPS
jgi:hypothetical protein